jgi:hypothetical protein
VTKLKRAANDVAEEAWAKQGLTRRAATTRSHDDPERDQVTPDVTSREHDLVPDWEHEDFRPSRGADLNWCAYSSAGWELEGFDTTEYREVGDPEIPKALTVQFLDSGAVYPPY